MIKKIALLLAILFISLGSFAQSLTPMRGKVKDGYNFWFYNPDSTSDAQAKPVVIFLHGASLCGNDLNRVKRYGTIDAIERGRALDAFVIAPQNPGGAWKPSKINAILEWAEQHYNIDKDRVYVLGMSLGGYGTIDMAAAYPDKIAAAMAFCGGGTTKDFGALSQVPLWIVHGTADKAVPVSASDKVVAGIKATGDDSRLIYHRVPGMNHGKPARYFYLAESYEWLFSHSLKDRSRRVNKRTFSTDLLATAYKDLGRNRKLNAEPVRAPKTHYKGEFENEIHENLAVAIPTDASSMLSVPSSLNTKNFPTAMTASKHSLETAKAEKKESKQSKQQVKKEQKKTDAPVKSTVQKVEKESASARTLTEEKPHKEHRSLKARRNS